MTTPLIIDREGPIETWTINGAARRNPITGAETMDALCAAVDRVNRGTEVRAVVLTGAGSAFSAGGDVKAMARRIGMFSGSPSELQDSYRRGIQRLTLVMHECEVPLIAAVNGAAIGAGCDLALMCDLRIASSAAYFAESFVKLGIIPGDGGAWLLPRVIGHARASQMILTGDRIDAATAADWGLVSKVVEPEALMAEALAMARAIAVNPPIAVRLAKRLLRASQTQRLDDVLDLSASLQVIAHQTDEHHEVMRALLEKEPAGAHAR
jgi:enoyl-CoA hydratase/carnithine racemase